MNKNDLIRYNSLLLSSDKHRIYSLKGNNSIKKLTPGDRTY